MKPVAIAFATALPLNKGDTFAKQCCRCVRPQGNTTRRRFLIRAQQTTGDDKENGEDSFDEDFDPVEEAIRRRRGVEPGAKMDEISSVDMSEVEREYNQTAVSILASQTGLSYLFAQLPKILLKRVERYLSKPQNLLLALPISVLFGFFSSTSATTIIGSVADWDPLAALVLLLITESFTRWYYRTELRKTMRVLMLLNAFKLGVYYGMAVDAFKLST